MDIGELMQDLQDIDEAKLESQEGGPKLVKLAPYIYNRQSFYFRDHPEYHPDTRQYLDYWESHEVKAIEGFWGLDQQHGRDPETKVLLSANDKNYDADKKGGYRFMTPQHYWYTNFCFIQHLPDEDAPPVTIMPDCRDIDWYWYYVFIIACGFSGFEGDTEVSCHTLLKRYYDHLAPGSKVTFELTPREKKTWAKVKHTLKKSDGTYKEYMDPLKYLSQTFDKPLGRIIYYNPMYNIADVEARGGGKSYRMLGVLSQYFNFFGARTFEQYLDVDGGPTLCVGSALSAKSGALLKKFEFSQNQLVDNFGSYSEPENDIFIPGFFYKKTAGVISSGNEKNPLRHEYKENIGGAWKKRGTFTKIVHQSYENNPEAFVGNRSVLMLEDEFGLNGNAMACAHADNTVMKMSGVKMGIALKSGTGGNVVKIQQAKEIFYNPDSYGYLRLEDFWEQRADGIGMFVPVYYVDSSFRDENGNQNIQEAYDQEMHNRQKLVQGNSTKMLDGYIIDHPLVPSEMFLSPEISIFPTVLLREHRARLEAKKVFETIASIGYLRYTDKSQNKVEWLNHKDTHNKPITTFDLKKYSGYIEGSIVIYEHPADNIPDPTFKKSLHKVTYDPVKDDFGGTSLAAIQVWKGSTIGTWNSGLQNTLVATYYGRFEKVEDMHEIAIKLALYYNAKVLPETDIPDFVRYVKKKNKAYLLQRSPFEAFTKLSINQRNKYEVGVKISKAINLQGEQLIRQWLLEEIGYDAKSGKKILNLHNLFDLRLLDELCNYDREKNTDGVSAFQLIMFWIYQENLIPTQEKDKEYHKSKIDTYFDNVIRKKGRSSARNSNSYNNQMFNW